MQLLHLFFLIQLNSSQHLFIMWLVGTGDTEVNKWWSPFDHVFDYLFPCLSSFPDYGCLVPREGGD